MSEVTIKDVHGLRVLCIAEIRGQISRINQLATQYNADIVIHTGNFGFFSSSSIADIPRKTLHHISIFSTEEKIRALALDSEADLKKALPENALSELPSFIKGNVELIVPVYTVYGSSEDLSVIQRFANGEYKVKNLHLITEKTTYKVNTPNGPPLRIMGLGGSFILHRIFDNGDGSGHIAGTHGLTWTTALQMGELVQTVKKIFNPKETRLFVSHASPGKEPLLYQLAMTLRADFTISSSLHFFYGSSYNEFTVNPDLEAFANKLSNGRREFLKIWDAIKDELDQLVRAESVERLLIETTVNMVKGMPDCSTAQGKELALKDEYLGSVFRNLWHFNLCDVASGALILTAEEGRVTMESTAQGFEFSSRVKRQDRSEKTDKSTTDRMASTVMPGIWISRCENSEEEVRLLFDEEDRELIQSIVIKSKQNKSSNGITDSANASSNAKVEKSSEEPLEEDVNKSSNDTAPDTVAEDVVDSILDDNTSEVSLADSPSEPSGETPSEPTEPTELAESTELADHGDAASEIESDEGTRHFAWVYFSSIEEAKTALGRLDPRASRATLISARPSRFSRGGQFSRPTRGFRRGGSRGGSRGGKFNR